MRTRLKRNKLAGWEQPRLLHHICVGCGGYVRHPGHLWRRMISDHLVLTTCSDCNPQLHDRVAGRNKEAPYRYKDNWYTQNQWDNWISAMESVPDTRSEHEE
jgi:hypothetical protein